MHFELRLQDSKTPLCSFTDVHQKELRNALLWQQPMLNIENGNELFEPMLLAESRLYSVVQVLVGCCFEATTQKYRRLLPQKREGAVLLLEATRRVKMFWMSLVFRQKLAKEDKKEFCRTAEEAVQVWTCREQARLLCHNGETKATFGVGLVAMSLLPVLLSQGP